MTERTPTTEDIRRWATFVPDTTVGMHVSERDAAAFDRWLAAHDAEVKADAGNRPLLSPCHGALLHVSTAYEGRPYMQEAVPESIECTAGRCYNSWDAKTGEPTS